METALRTQSPPVAGTRKGAGAQYQEPKRLSKLGQWMRNNPGGIGVIIDQKAVNK